VLIADERFSLATQDEIQAEVDQLISLDQQSPSGVAHVAESVLRRYPDTPQPVLVQIAVLEGSVVRQRTIVEIVFWASVGSALIKLLRAFPSGPGLGGSDESDPLTRKLPTGPRLF